jgi:xanthine dehydrogenase accessory factor
VARHDVLAAALTALDASRGVAIATVVGASGSTPRHLGARMAVAADGEQWGTIGGGRIEAAIVEAARAVAAGAPPRALRHHLVRDLAMCCGGTMEVAIASAAASRPALGAARAGAMLVTPLDGGALVVRPPRAGDPPLHRPAIVDGAVVERIAGRERAIVIGLGHVARVLGPLLAGIGFTVVVCDDNELGTLDTTPPWADVAIASFELATIERELGGLGGDDHVLVVTRDHAIDQKLLEQLVTRADLAYLGMIGSRGKLGRFKKRLDAKGIGDAAAWARLRSPIGLDIGAETPEEIAIAIAAELVAVRRRGGAVGGWSGDDG